MKKKMLILLFIVVAIVLCGCSEIYTAENIEEARKQGYEEGYNYGYYWGAEHQQEKDYKDLVLDGVSITDIAIEVHKKYGITPGVAFATYEQYNDDPIGSGITWEEYQNAINAVFYTAQLFPRDISLDY